jgi:hypothetical protein
MVSILNLQPPSFIANRIHGMRAIVTIRPHSEAIRFTWD